jgi:cytochrome P450
MGRLQFVKFGLTTEAFRSYVSLITGEVEDYLKKSQRFKGQTGTVNIPAAMAELTIFTASRSLQGKEVREKFDERFAELYHDLDMGFSPINFMLPWAPLPHNRKRDAAREKMAETYMEIIKARRAAGGKKESDEEDMIWNLMSCKYKEGHAPPDHEIAHMMIALLMAGQHSSSSTITWIILRLASQPHITEELLQEQKDILGADLPPLTYEDLSRLPLHIQVVKETLRLHAPIHSVMRKVKNTLPIDGTPYVVPKGHVLLAAPGVAARYPEFFPNPMYWDPHRWDEDKAAHMAAGHVFDDDDEKVDYGWGLISKGTNSPYLPFGAGRHRCIGEQFAYVQLQTILVNFVRVMKVRNTDGSERVPETDFSSLFSRPMNPAIIEWERRG